MYGHSPYRYNPDNVVVASGQASGGADTTKLLLGGLLIVVGAGGLIWWYQARSKAQAQNQAAPQTQQTQSRMVIGPGLETTMQEGLTFDAASAPAAA